ncbi:unnamed protein product [Prunus brigantina]
MQRQNPLGLATAVLWAEAEGRKRHGRRYYGQIATWSQDQDIKCVPTAKGAKPTIRAVAEICRDLWGSHHHASRFQMPI